MKTFNVRLSLEKEIEAEDEGQACNLFIEELEDKLSSENQTLISYLVDHLQAEENKNLKLF